MQWSAQPPPWTRLAGLVGVAVAVVALVIWSARRAARAGRARRSRSVPIVWVDAGTLDACLVVRARIGTFQTAFQIDTGYAGAPVRQLSSGPTSPHFTSHLLTALGRSWPCLPASRS